ncbi:MAG: glycosyltransferase family 4 protein [Anaerocolumna sp.]
MKFISKTILYTTQLLKPLLFRIFPKSLLRYFKGKMIVKSLVNMGKLEIEPFQRSKYKDGINLIGNIKAETGLGQSFRLVTDEINISDYKFTILNYSQLGSSLDKNEQWNHKVSTDLPYNVNLIHINPHELGLAFTQLHKSVWDYRYNIAFWLWEIEEFPDEWVPCFNCLDEIWTPSEFISQSIRKKTNLPVKTIPYCVSVKIQKNPSRKYFNLPEEQFLFLTMYDHNSIVERKNPIAVINAFKKAFDSSNTKVGLVIKINNTTKDDLRMIETAMKGYSNYYIMTETFSKADVNSLIQITDVLVSLHRAEGFGLVLAEAMMLGTPTIATNWSSNTEFMNTEVSCLVKYDMKIIEKDLGPFKKGNRWADPDVGDAAGYMRELYDNPLYYKKIADKAKSYIDDKLSMDKATQLINHRIKEIYGGF